MRRIQPVIDEHGMHGIITVSRKRQITIPKFAQMALGIGPGSRVRIDGQLSVQPGDRLRLTVAKGRIELRPVAKRSTQATRF